MYDAAADRFHGWNRARAERRYVPASTFKIANSLIGLETGTIGSVEEVLPYGGKPQPFAAWERDMGLREAIKVSNVPVYQELARRIGLERMQALLTRLNYGNQASGSEVDRFWLQGPLTISPAEQAIFLARLATNQLPVADAAQRDVRDITLLEAADGIELHGKTGWYQADGNEPDVGWWVGWARKDDRVYSFALNMDMPDAESLAAKRIPLGKACLRSLGVLRSSPRVRRDSGR